MDEMSKLGARLVELLKQNGYESVTGRSKYGVDIAGRCSTWNAY